MRHVPNAPRNKNVKSHNPYLLKKIIFLPSKTLLPSLDKWKKEKTINFEHYNFAKGKEWVCKI
jgi:hypothetical protein